MTFDDFIKKYDGKGIDYDGAYGFQCVDVIQQYSIEVLGIGPWGSGNAVGRWEDYPREHFDRIVNTPEGIPQKGDVMIWGKGAGPYGHIAIFIEGTAGSFRSFDQNWPVGSKCHIQGHYYNNVLGWLRPKKEVSMNCDEEKRKVFAHVFNAVFMTFYGKSFENPVEHFKKDVDYWYGVNPDWGVGTWITQQPKEAEFKQKWFSKEQKDKEVEKAVAQTQKDYQKEMSRWEAKVTDLNKSIDEQAGLCAEATVEMQKKIDDLQAKLDKNTKIEKVVFEFFIWEKIKSIFKKGA